MKSWLDYRNHFSNDFRLLEELTKYKVSCPCGHYVYINKRVEFKEKLRRLLKIEGVYQ